MNKTVTLVAVLLSATTVFSQKQETSMPRFSSDAEKAAWIANHPEDYERMTGEKVTTVIPEFKTQAEKDAWLKSLELNGEQKFLTISDDPTFPKYIITGNKEMDDLNYENAKAEWIAKNPKKYELMDQETDESGLSRSERMKKHGIVEPNQK
jgi:hypothetical protein